MKDPVAGLRAIFDRPGPRLVMGQPVHNAVRYSRDDESTAVYMAQLCAMYAIPHRTLAGTAEIQFYVDEVLAMPWPRWHAGPAWTVTVRVVPGLTAASGTAIYDSGILYVREVEDELILLHELAHHLAARDHGSIFVAAFLDLVDKVMNPAAHCLFQACLAAEGVST